MECPNCNAQLKRMEPESRGMGNQRFEQCPVCGFVALFSGKVLTQSWPPLDGQEGLIPYARNGEGIYSGILGR